MKKISLLCALALLSACSASPAKRNVASAPDLKTPYNWRCDGGNELHVLFEKKPGIWPWLIFTVKGESHVYQVDFPVGDLLKAKDYKQVDGKGAVGMNGYSLFTFQHHAAAQAISVEAKDMSVGGQTYRADHCVADF